MFLIVLGFFTKYILLLLNNLSEVVISYKNFLKETNFFFKIYCYI
jgi:hypothetical protein